MENQIQQIEVALERFLGDERPGVLAIKGEWGVGKTYFWKKFIETKRDSLKQVAYSYASLFGTSSVGELRRAIFTNQEPMGRRSESVLTWIGNRASDVLRHIDFGTFTGGALKNTEILSDLIQDKLLKNFLVCIDDLERKEEDVSPSALLGFIANLRDERNCKVVLLYNESKTDEDGPFKKALGEFREKVIDREITFNPTVEECYALIFDKKSAIDDLPKSEDPSAAPYFGSDGRSVLELFQALDVSNIRVLGKTRDAIAYFEPHIKKNYPKLWPHFVRQLVKLSCLHYIHGEKLPLEMILKSSSLTDYYLEKSDEPKKREEYERRKPIRAVGYHPSKTDDIIAQFLLQGYVDWATRAKLLAAEDLEFQSNEVRTGHRLIWSMLWANFQASQDEFVAAQEKYLEDNWKVLTLADVDGAAQFLRKIASSPRADAVLELRIKEFVANCSDPNAIDIFHNVSSETASKARKLLAQKDDSKPIFEAIRIMTRPGGWNSPDIRYLTATTEDQFYAWLEEEKGDDVLSMLKEFRSRFGRTPEEQAVVARLDGALHRIAKRSKLDDIRVYGNIGIPRPSEGSG